MNTIWLISNLLFCYAVGRASGHQSSSWATEVQCTRPGLHCVERCKVLEMCVFENGGSSSIVVEYCGNLNCHSPPGECNPDPLDAPCTYEFACQSQGQFPHPYDCTKYCSCDSGLHESCSTCTQLGTAYNATSGKCDADIQSQACTDNPVPLCEVPAGIYPLAEDPSIYYVCLPDGNGNLQPRFYKCLDGNEFDVDTKQCSTFKCSESGFFPDPLNCTYYYYCSPELISFHYRCPTDTIYNSTLGKCVDGDCSLPEDPSSCDEVGIFPDEEDCTMYYACLPDLIRIHVQCSGNTHFDRVTEKCVDGPCEDSETTPLPFPPCTSPGIFPDPDDCTKYYLCLNDGTWIHQSCSSGHYDVDERTCVPGPCPTDPTTTTEPPPSFICPSSGIFPDPEDCTKYYLCLNDGTSIHQSCSSGHFDAGERTCVPGPCPTDPTTTTEPPSSFICPSSGIFPDPEDCTKYYLCLNDGTSIHQSCSSGHFDAGERTCIPGPCPTQTNPTTTTVETTTSNIFCTSPGIFPDPDDCTKYYLCLTDGTWIHQSCSSGHYDAEERTCVAGPCPTQTNPTTTPIQTTPIFLCPSPGIFPDPDDCTKYYLCLNDGTLIHQTCSSGHYDAEEKICVSGPCPPPFDCTEPGYFPNRLNCTTYFICFNNLTVIEASCPSGFHFDEFIRVCVEGPCEKLASQTSFICTILGFFMDPVDCTFFAPKTS